MDFLDYAGIISQNSGSRKIRARFAQRKLLGACLPAGRLAVKRKACFI
ncbi:MAG: hypothetical protein WC460_02205 [Patescibacteria group bacterium]